MNLKTITLRKTRMEITMAKRYVSKSMFQIFRMIPDILFSISVVAKERRREMMGLAKNTNWKSIYI